MPPELREGTEREGRGRGAGLEVSAPAQQARAVGGLRQCRAVALSGEGYAGSHFLPSRAGGRTLRPRPGDLGTNLTGAGRFRWGTVGPGRERSIWRLTGKSGRLPYRRRTCGARKVGCGGFGGDDAQSSQSERRRKAPAESREGTERYGRGRGVRPEVSAPAQPARAVGGLGRCRAVAPPGEGNAGSHPHPSRAGGRTPRPRPGDLGGKLPAELRTPSGEGGQQQPAPRTRSGSKVSLGLRSGSVRTPGRRDAVRRPLRGRRCP